MDLGVGDFLGSEYFQLEGLVFDPLGRSGRRRDFSSVLFQNSEGEQFELEPFFELSCSWMFAPVSREDPQIVQCHAE
ncbi:hypothetical protein C9439_02280 [archaeon SCG-AAA382B04]|nr:hypothetical protein C9439_02280 [archaeon SCG-AAA382B04]